LGASDTELYEAKRHHSDTVSEAGGDDVEMTSTTNDDSKKRSKVVSFFKGGAKAAVETALGVDRIRAKFGKESAKQRLGAIPSQDDPGVAGPCEFKARYHGQKGNLYVSLANGTPYVTFFADIKSTKEKVGLSDAGNGAQRPLWSVPVTEIRELKKHSGYGFKTKLLVGWALEHEIRDGLEIVDRANSSFVVTAIPQRDELFNRLCAMGGQKWEIW
jgi:hypothetical protein